MIRKTKSLIKVNNKKRICKYKGCNTPLSRYNIWKYCFMHQRQRASEIERKRLERYDRANRIKVKLYEARRKTKKLKELKEQGIKFT